jgi:hypothetical protein
VAEPSTEHVRDVISYKVKMSRCQPIYHTYNLFQFFSLALVVLKVSATFLLSEWLEHRTRLTPLQVRGRA